MFDLRHELAAAIADGFAERGTSELREAVEALARLMPVRLLIVDDEQPGSMSVKDFYSDQPVTVFWARSLQEADGIIDREEIDVAVVDIDFRGKETGETWILRNRDKLSGVEVIVLTGQERAILDKERLEHVIGREVATKGEGDSARVLQFPPELARARAKERLRNAVSTEPGLMRLKARWQRAFAHWASQLGEGDETVVSIGDKLLSPAALIKEVEDGTALGERLLELFEADRLRTQEAQWEKLA